MLKTYATQELIPFYTPKSPTKIREEPKIKAGENAVVN